MNEIAEQCPACGKFNDLNSPTAAFRHCQNCRRDVLPIRWVRAADAPEAGQLPTPRDGGLGYPDAGYVAERIKQAAPQRQDVYLTPLAELRQEKERPPTRKPRRGIQTVRAAGAVKEQCLCMVCCPDTVIVHHSCPCGNKRCPHSTFHEHACTGSNEPGQAGSIFGDWTSEMVAAKRAELGLPPRGSDIRAGRVAFNNWDLERRRIAKTGDC